MKPIESEIIANSVMNYIANQGDVNIDLYGKGDVAVKIMQYLLGH